MGIRIAMAGLVALATAQVAEAKCESLVRTGSNQEGQPLLRTYKRLIACDAEEAKAAYTTFMQRAGSGGSETLADLAMLAIEAQLWNPVWEMIGKISDYNARDEVAAVIGEKCGETESVVNFLQGAYFGLRDLDFKQWDDALITCGAPSFENWLITTVENPPPKQYDEKWDTLADVLVERKKAAALPHLSKAAVAAAANSGPYDTILAHMANSIDAPFGQEPNPEDVQALQGALVEVAKQVDPDRARAVAGQLADAGSEAQAASLLATIYPERVQDNGGFLYAAASVEAGTCQDGEKRATIHLAVVSEPGQRFDIFDEVTEPLRAVRARLKKCTIDTDPWPIWVSDTPLAKRGEAKEAAGRLIEDWEGRGYSVRVRNERDVELD